LRRIGKGRRFVPIALIAIIVAMAMIVMPVCLPRCAMSLAMPLAMTLGMLLASPMLIVCSSQRGCCEETGER
jgi:sugar phosphate permease